MKFCKDCVHCRPVSHHVVGGSEWVSYAGAHCALTDLVTGSGSAGRLCSEERGARYGCGEGATNFQRIPPPSQKPIQPRRWWQP